MLDIVFCSLPYSNLDHIYSAPAILKGVVEANGFRAKTIDFGCELLNQVDRNENKFNQAQLYFISTDKQNQNQEQEQDIRLFYSNCINFFKKNPSKYIGISVFSIYTHRAVYELCKLIKEEQIESKIIIGGRGAKVPCFYSIINNYNITGTDKLASFGSLLQKRKLIDYLILGDGEDAILQILNNKELKTDNFQSDEFRSPVPDYSDYNFKNYLFTDEVMLPVTGSKGCVRDCDFCDVKFQFGNYRYRSGKAIAQELITISQKFGIYKFQFTDSLVNGGLKPFREFLTELSEYNLQNPDQKITWNGQYICRPELQSHLDLYPLMRDAGAHGLTIGVESGSNKVLAAMNKNTTVEALYAELENFRKNNITCMLLTFTGHWSETWEDFLEHCKMFINIAPYVRLGTVSGVSLGILYSLLDGTPSMFNHKLNSVEFDPDYKEHFWINKNNPGNTFKERLYRRLLLLKLCQELNIPTVADKEIIMHYIDVVNTSFETINDFYKKYSGELVHY